MTPSLPRPKVRQVGSPRHCVPANRRAQTLRGRHYATVVALAWSLTHCGTGVAPVGDATDTQDSSDSAPLDVLDVLDATDATDAPDVVDVPRRDAVDAADIADVPDPGDLVQCPRATDPSGCTGTVTTTSAACGTMTPCALTLDATLSCAHAGFGGSLALGSGDQVYVAGTTNVAAFIPHLFTIAPPAVRVDAEFIRATTAWLVTDSTGRLSALGSEVPDRGVALFEREGMCWRGRRVSPDARDFYFVRGAEYAVGGALHVLFAAPSSPVFVAVRPPGGAFAITALGSRSMGAADLALGPTGERYAGWWNFDAGLGLRELQWRRDVEPVVSGFRTVTNADNNEVVELVTPRAGDPTTAPLVAFEQSDGLRIGRATGPTATYRTVAGTAPAMTTGCMPTMCSGPPGDRGTCEDRGDGAAEHTMRLGRTIDGRVWLAYVARHVDRTLQISVMCMGPTFCFCRTTPGDDRSTAALVIASVSDDGAVVTERGRWPLGRAVDIREAALATRGNDLHVLVTSSYDPGLRMRYLRVNTAALP